MSEFCRFADRLPHQNNTTWHYFEKSKKKNQTLIPEKKILLLKVTLLHDCFLRFLNCTNGTKSRNASHLSENKIQQRIKWHNHSLLELIFTEFIFAN